MNLGKKQTEHVKLLRYHQWNELGVRTVTFKVLAVIYVCVKFDQF